MAGVAGVPVVVARVTVEQGVPAAAHALDDGGARRDGRHVLTGHCGHARDLTVRIRFSLKLLACVCCCNLPRRPFSRVNEWLVNMHSKATRWNTLLTVLCVPTMRTYLKHRRTPRRYVTLHRGRRSSPTFHFTLLPAHSWREVQILPRAAQILGMIHNTHPVQLVHGHLDVVGVGPETISRDTV